MPTKTSFDPLDYQIVHELHANVRASAAEIARKVGANERTVRNRIERLIADNVIRPTAVINPEAFGYITATDIFLEAEPELEDEIIQALRSIPEVTYIAFGQGSRDISIAARFKNNDDMRQFMRRVMPNIPGVLVKGYALVPRILRNIDEWAPKKEDFGLPAE